MTFASFFVALVGPILARILASLGVGLVTITGLSVALAAVKALVSSGIGSLPVFVIQLGGAMGMWSALGMIFGTYTFLITWKGTAGFMSLKKL